MGFCGFWDGFAPDVEIGWRLRPEYWGQGLATEAAKAVMEYGFRRWGFPRLISVAQPKNRASIRIMEKLGMEFERTSLHEGFEGGSISIGRDVSSWNPIKAANAKTPPRPMPSPRKPKPKNGGPAPLCGEPSHGTRRYGGRSNRPRATPRPSPPNGRLS
jgi:hypothetical protein